MSQEIRNLEPKALWNQFADLNALDVCMDIVICPRQRQGSSATHRQYQKGV